MAHSETLQVELSAERLFNGRSLHPNKETHYNVRHNYDEVSSCLFLEISNIVFDWPLASYPVVSTGWRLQRNAPRSLVQGITRLAQITWTNDASKRLTIKKYLQKH